MNASKLFFKIFCAAVMVLILAVGCRHAPTKDNVDEKPAQPKWISKIDTSCVSDSDCRIIEADCCGCNQGGKQVAINRLSYDKAHATQVYTCSESVCVQMMSNDASCGKSVAKCVDGTCSL